MLVKTQASSFEISEIDDNENKTELHSLLLRNTVLIKEQFTKVFMFYVKNYIVVQITIVSVFICFNFKRMQYFYY